VIVGSSVANVTANIAIDATAEITSGSFTLFSPAGAVVTTVPVSPSNLDANSSTSHGMYVIPFTIPANSTPGAYKWRISVNTSVATSTPDASFGWEGMTPLPSGVPATLTVIADPFATWASLNSLVGINATRDADPDKDGVKNLIEYQCGLNPNQASLPAVTVSGATITQLGLPQITVTGTGSQRRLRVVYLRRLGDTTVTSTVQFSDNLTVWANATQTYSVVATSATHEAVAVEDQIFIPARDLRFGKVNYVYTP
jgi:hypothetical protein